MKYAIYFTKQAIKQLEKVPNEDYFRIKEAIQQLSNHPYPNGTKKLRGRDAYRIRQGSYRIIYEVHKQKVAINIIAIGHRKDIYR